MGCASYPDFTLDPRADLFEQPYGDLRALLEKAEDEVDWRQKDLAALAAAMLPA
jgi:hypothetical protein